MVCHRTNRGAGWRGFLSLERVARSTWSSDRGITPPPSSACFPKASGFHQQPRMACGGKSRVIARFQSVGDLVLRTPDLCLKRLHPRPPTTTTGPSIRGETSQDIKIKHFDQYSQPSVGEGRHHLSGRRSGEPRHQRVSLSNTVSRAGSPNP